MSSSDDTNTTGRLSRVRGLAKRTLGELAVIVLGVTVALWADGWVAERNDRVEETARVQALLENVNATLERVRAAHTEADSAAAALRQLATPRAVRGEADMERLLLAGFFYVPIFHPELSVYDDLKNSGELSLLRDDELRRALSSLDGRLQQLGIGQQDMATVQQLNYDPYLINRIDLRNVLGEYLGLDPVPEKKKSDLSFVDELDFRNLVLFKLDLADQMAHHFERVEDTLLEIRELIDLHLESGL